MDSFVLKTAVESDGGSNSQTRTDSKLFSTSFLIWSRTAPSFVLDDEE